LEYEKKWTIKYRETVERDDSYVKLGDLFSVRRGIATGANDFFVLERERARELGIPDVALTPLLPKAKSLTSDIVAKKRDGYPAIDRQLCVIDTAMSENEILEKYPDFMMYLEKGKNDGIKNGHLVGRRHPWYKQEIREPAPFLCTYMGKAHANKPPIRFIWNKSKAIATNTYLLLYPNKELSVLIAKKPNIAEALFDLLKASTWEALAEHARQHAGGLSKIEPKELLQVWLGPVPQEILDTADRQLF
jgi:hypothetical protein